MELAGGVRLVMRVQTEETGERVFGRQLPHHRRLPEPQSTACR